MGPAESYFGRASLPVALVRRCDLSHSVSSCSLHEVLEVVQPVHRHRVAARLAGCSFPFYGLRIWGAYLPFRIFRIGCVSNISIYDIDTLLDITEIDHEHHCHSCGPPVRTRGRARARVAAEFGHGREQLTCPLG